MKPFYFYHLISNNVDLDTNGIVSPQFMYDSRLFDTFDKVVDKYRDRLVNGWGYYPDKKPETLTREEIITGIKRFRKSENALAKIYAFKYPPYLKLGRRMSDILLTKKVLRFDVERLYTDNLVEGIDWGYWMSNNDNKELDRKYYESISIDAYYKEFDDNHDPVFASLNHIGIITTTKCIPLKYIEVFEVPLTLEEAKRFK